ncbi:leucine-rich colipase-like protein 1 [Perognathus longimembris pacificus]|uniref:leucine-rich colipase-like protein 1 n=1 Tax=Perognathus longimembris pacificus TaxID=214514 RepID=UPI00201A0C42|nr:leucine-rich colipase-like protein 1 [Perognathus longimembris pacificus]
MSAAGGLLLLLLLPWEAPASLQSRKESVILSHKENGETCKDNSECQTNCCVRTSQNPQKFCTTPNLFQQCLPWRKVGPSATRAPRHEECYSDCCVQNSIVSGTYCTRKAILNCVSWRKPDGFLCHQHKECRSQCCIQVGETSPTRCRPRTGFLAKCLPLVGAGAGGLAGSHSPPPFLQQFRCVALRPEHWGLRALYQPLLSRTLLK